MKRSRVSVRGQTVIPQEIRHRFGIEPNTELAWSTDDGVITVVPIPKDPTRGLHGVLKGKGPSSADVAAERAKDLELEQKRLEPWLNEK